MKEEEILENNKLIAGWMDCKYRADLSGTMYNHVSETELFLPSKGIVRFDTIDVGKGPIIKYHKSWDWLMEVWGKIMSIDDYANVDDDSSWSEFYIYILKLLKMDYGLVIY